MFIKDDNENTEPVEKITEFKPIENPSVENNEEERPQSIVKEEYEEVKESKPVKDAPPKK